MKRRKMTYKNVRSHVFRSGLRLCDDIIQWKLFPFLEVTSVRSLVLTSRLFLKVFLGVDWGMNVQFLGELLRRPNFVWAMVRVWPAENHERIGNAVPLRGVRRNKLALRRDPMWEGRQGQVFLYRGAWPSGRKRTPHLDFNLIVRWAAPDEVQEHIKSGFLRLPPPQLVDLGVE